MIKTKEKKQGKALVGYIAILIIGALINLIPIYAIGIHNTMQNVIMYIIMGAYPPSTIIFWVWGLIKVIGSWQDSFSIFYYISFVVLFIPSYIGVLEKYFIKKR